MILDGLLLERTLRFFGTLEEIVSCCIIRNNALNDIVVVIKRKVLTKGVLHLPNSFLFAVLRAQPGNGILLLKRGTI